MALGKRTCDDQEAKVELKKLCEDPVRYVCSKAPPRGRYLNSACKITFYDNESAAQLPEVMGTMKKIDVDTAQFVAVHQQECNFIGPPCSDQLRVLHEKDFKMIALNAAYTPERLERLNEAFIKVKNAARSLIQNSKRLTLAQKSFILKQIEHTTLRDPFKDSLEPCELPNGSEPDTGVYNDSLGANSKRPKITICLGSIAETSRQDDASLMLTLGHELTHSIDPCTMDTLSLENNKIWNGNQIYGPIIACLRGVKDLSDCNTGVLHCNDEISKKGYCSNNANLQQEVMGKMTCPEFLRRVPNCNFGLPDPTDQDEDLSHYRKAPGTVAQINESFSDFFGAQIYAKILKDDEITHHGTLTQLRKRDIAASMGAEFASLHGICLKENTNDEHPPGTIRVLNNILGNKDLGHLLCSQFKGKQCEGL